MKDQNSYSNYKFINADLLKLLAIFFMLLDHMWATIIPGNQWMTYVGRLAFPIFAFQISEGFIHTSNYKAYLKRLFIFGLLSEIPFNLMINSSLIYPFHQNVMFTLFLGLLTINEIEKSRRNPSTKNSILAAGAIVLYPLLATFTFTDYGAMGVWTVVLFYLYRDFKFAWAFQLLGMVIINLVILQGMYIDVDLFGMVWDFQTQGFAVLALIPIWLYNGKKGSNSPIFKYSMYIFYPAHMLILYLIFKFR